MTANIIPSLPILTGVSTAVTVLPRFVLARSCEEYADGRHCGILEPKSELR
jgi:hypothetical protein